MQNNQFSNLISRSLKGNCFSVKEIKHVDFNGIPLMKLGSYLSELLTITKLTVI